MNIEITMPQPPEELHSYAKEEWFRIIDHLLLNGYEEIHKASLITYCSMYSDLQIMNEEFLNKPEGLIYGYGGTNKINPLIVERRNHAIKLVVLAKELGFNLADKIKDKKRKEEDNNNPFSEFLREPNISTENEHVNSH